MCIRDRCIFELSGGVIKNNTALDSGGGVRVVDQASFVMTGGEISGNQATYSGGGVLCSGKAELRGGEIKNNTAGWGAGVAVWGGVNDQAVLTVSDTASIIGNQANGNGAGVYVEDSIFNMTGGAITGNITETGNGGGLFGYHSSRDTVLKISGGTISGNQGTGSGTAVALNGSSDYARLELSGAPDIDGDVFLRDDRFSDIQVEVTGAFTPAQPVVLSLTQLDDDGKQVISYAEGATSSANAFMSKNQGYIINAEGVLVKVVQVPNPCLLYTSRCV